MIKKLPNPNPKMRYNKEGKFTNSNCKIPE
jgi:hypothetical protein